MYSASFGAFRLLLNQKNCLKYVLLRCMILCVIFKIVLEQIVNYSSVFQSCCYTFNASLLHTVRSCFIFYTFLFCRLTNKWWPVEAS